MLAGQQLGRGQQGSLFAGLDHRQGGQQGHQRLAAGHLALQEAGPGVSGKQVLLDLGQRPLLVPGQAEWQTGQQPGFQAPGVAVAPAADGLPGSARAVQLQVVVEQFGVGQGAPGGRLLVFRLREVQAAQGRAGPRQAVAGAQALGDFLGQLADRFQPLRRQAAHHPLAHSLGQGVHGEDPAHDPAVLPRVEGLQLEAAGGELSLPALETP